MNFEDVREYQPGDEIRSIDWNVTARMGSAFVKKFTEERELTVMLVVDVSASGNFGSTTQSKRELAAEVACLLAFSAIRNNDKVGLFSSLIASSFSFRRRKVVRTRCVSFARFCFSNRRDAARSPALALDYLNKIVTRRAVVFFISDFQAPDFSRALAVSGRRHDFIAIQIKDERERSLPNVGIITLEDAETGEQIEINTADRKTRTVLYGPRHWNSKRSFRARSGGTMLMRSRCKPERIICRRCARFSNNANAASGFDEEAKE